MKPAPSTDLVVRFWGVRGSIPAPDAANLRYGGNTSCIEVRCGSEVMILDAGSGLRSLGVNLLREAAGKPIEGTMLISHTHWDHIQGLPFFAPAYDGRNRFRLMAGPAFGNRIGQGLRDQMGPLHFPVRFEQMPGLASVEELSSGENVVGSFSVRTVALNHPGGCIGFRLDAFGKSIAYLPDHEPYGSASAAAVTAQAALVEFVRGIDFLILDTQYTAEEFALRKGWGHGSLPESVDLALAAGVKELVLYHHDPSHHDGQIDAMLAMARHCARGTALVIRAAQEQDEVVLRSKSGVQPTPAPQFSVSV